MRAVLDTSVLVATDIAEIEGELAISAISLAELHFGTLVTAKAEVRAERLRRLAFIVGHFDALPVDDRVAASYGELAAIVTRNGRSPRARSNDLLIAATAHAHGARLCTRNPADFAGLEHALDLLIV